ncbi:MAG: hypothetical protein WBW04_21595 [Nitrolancea sp.]
MIRATVAGLIALSLLVGCGSSHKSSTITSVTPNATIGSTAEVVVSSPTSTKRATPVATPKPTATPTLKATPRPSATPVASPAATPTPNLGARGTPTPTDQVKSVLASDVTSEYAPIDPTSTFSTDSSKVYLAFTTVDLSADSTLSAVWIAEKVDADVSSNYVIDHADLKVSGSQAGVFSLSSPTAGFPKGDYRVDLYLNGTLIGSFPFKVK